MVRSIFYRYIWLVEQLNNTGGLSLAEINARWVHNIDISEGNPLPERSFHNYRAKIEEIFDINIDYDRGQGKYIIKDDEGLQQSRTRQWLLNTFSLQNMLTEGRGLGSRIEFENVPSGEKRVSDIVRAMQTGIVLRIVYNNFWKGETTERYIEPYMLKIFKQRWYVVANERGSKIKVFALDRIVELDRTEDKFGLPKNFDPEAYFADCYGVVNDSAIDVQQVEVRVYGGQVNYFREVPLHHSQTEIETTPDYSVFSYRLRPTYDLRRELQFKGDEVEVIAPQWFRDEISANLKNAYLRYQ